MNLHHVTMSATQVGTQIVSAATATFIGFTHTQTATRNGAYTMSVKTAVRMVTAGTVHTIIIVVTVTANIQKARPVQTALPTAVTAIDAGTDTARQTMVRPATTAKATVASARHAETESAQAVRHVQAVRQTAEAALTLAETEYAPVARHA